MRPLSDATVAHLREVADWPELAGTRYELRETLGRGGMGTVYRAFDAELQRDVALKVLRPEAAGEAMAERLRREARVLARLEHPGIVPVHDVGRLPDGRVFYAMKLVRGQRLDRHALAAPGLPALLRAFERVCETMAFAHEQGVLHRDLKPENVMVGAFGEVLVLDWGLAKLREHPEPSAAAPAAPGAGATAHGTVLGTPGFMPPEQARGELERVDARSDVYALGALLYFLLTGAPPGADPEPPRRKRPGVPRPLEAICLKALARDPGLRYAGARELAWDVACYLEGLAVAAYPEGLLARARRLLLAHRALATLVAAYLVVRVLLLLARP